MIIASFNIVVNGFIFYNRCVKKSIIFIKLKKSLFYLSTVRFFLKRIFKNFVILNENSFYEMRVILYPIVVSVFLYFYFYVL